MSVADILYPNRFKKLDLHGYDRETARVAILDFIEDALKMQEEYVVIIHGTGKGIIRNTTNEVLKHHRNVLEYGLDYFNQGQTIIKLKKEGVNNEKNNNR